ncbi:hypothetical protein WMY93_032855, partial [Mugilogobius chulae]
MSPQQTFWVWVITVIQKAHNEPRLTHYCALLAVAEPEGDLVNFSDENYYFCERTLK